MEPISFRCSACQQPLKFPAERAGRKAKCTRCGAEQIVPEKSASEKTEPEKPASPPPPPPPSGDDDEEEGGKHYAVVTDPTTEEKKKLPPGKKKKDKAKAAIKKRKKSLVDADQWGIVRHGLLLMSIGAGLWLTIFCLQGLFILIGSAEGPEYNTLRTELIGEETTPPGAGTMGNLDKLRFSLGLIAGSNNLSLFRFMYIVLSFMTLVQMAFFLMGYFTCLVVPPRFGTRGQVITMICLGIFNLLAMIGFRLLPLLGIVPYALIPYLVPEIPLIQANMERALPLHVFWSAAPFWEMLLTFTLLGCQYLEYNMGPVFIRSIGLSIKEEPVQDRAMGLLQLGFGAMFALLCYHIVSVCGTSDVIISVIRLNYLAWTGFLILFIVRYMLQLNATRQIIDKLVKGEIEEEEEEEQKAKKEKKEEKKEKKKKKKKQEEDEEEE
jgi:hypothetical protein